jgi:predicted site-specific integrase-resolvase
MSPRAAGTRPRYASNVVVVYARLSSADQRADLDRQVARLSGWTGEQGIPVGCVVTEVGSAVNGERWTVLALLRDPDVATIVVEHRDRFARFGEPPRLPILGASIAFLAFQSPRSVIGAGQWLPGR